MLEHNIPEEQILNLDQNPLGLKSASKVSFVEKGSKRSLANINDKRQIMGIYCVSLTDEFLPVPQIQRVT